MLTLPHYWKFSKVFFRVCAFFLSLFALVRKADVDDASFSNLFPINTILTSGRLGYLQKKTGKKVGKCRRDSGRTAEKLAEQSYTVHIPLTYE